MEWGNSFRYLGDPIEEVPLNTFAFDEDIFERCGDMVCSYHVCLNRVKETLLTFFFNLL